MSKQLIPMTLENQTCPPASLSSGNPLDHLDSLETKIEPESHTNEKANE